MKSNTLVKMVELLPNKVKESVSKWYVNHLLKKYASISVSGEEYISSLSQPVIFICNHLSNSDGLILNKVLKTVDPTFVAGVKLSQNSVTSIGMNVVKTTAITPNSADTKSLKSIIKLVKKGESILIFPEGTRSRTGSMLEAKKGVLLIAKMTGAPIIPIGLYGSEKLLPINKDGNMGSEVFNPASVNVNIGQAFNLPTRDETQDKKAFDTYSLEFMMKKIALLLPESYRGYYK